MSPDLICAIIFGIVSAIIGIVAIWQGKGKITLSMYLLYHTLRDVCVCLEPTKTPADPSAQCSGGKKVASGVVRRCIAITPTFATHYSRLH